jgi:hypothetical protein
MREVEYRRMFNGPGAYEHEELFVRDYFVETVSDVDAMEQLKARVENMYFELQRQRENERQAKLENLKKAEMEREQREKGRAAAIELYRERQRVRRIQIEDHFGECPGSLC